VCWFESSLGHKGLLRECGGGFFVLQRAKLALQSGRTKKANATEGGVKVLGKPLVRVTWIIK
jgi:hypothetical protein